MIYDPVKTLIFLVIKIDFLHAEVYQKVSCKNIWTNILGFARYALIGINALFGLLGIALLGIGGYVMVEMKKYSVSKITHSKS